MAWLDANHMAQLERESIKRGHRDDFLRAHPEYRNAPPPHEWPALADPLLGNLPAPLAQAFAPLIAKPEPKEGE